MTTTTVTMTIKGETYKAREQLKREGFRWDAADKSWSQEYVQDGDVFLDLKGNHKGTLWHIRHMVKCYAKSDLFEIEVQ